MRTLNLMVVAMAAAIALGGAAIESGAARPVARVEAVASVEPEGGTRVLVGEATYYADDFHGRVMANGLVFDMHDPAITASNIWPLGTRLRVSRASLDFDPAIPREEQAEYLRRSVIVTVQDRGAFAHDLDLSAAAFALLGRPAEGRLRVFIEPLADPSSR